MAECGIKVRRPNYKIEELENLVEVVEKNKQRLLWRKQRRINRDYCGGSREE